MTKFGKVSAELAFDFCRMFRDAEGDRSGMGFPCVLLFCFGIFKDN
jgi:hypothetical protein